MIYEEYGLTNQLQVKKLNNWIENIKKADLNISQCQECNRIPFNIFGTMVNKSKKETEKYCIECLVQEVQKQARKKKLIKCSIKYYYSQADLITIVEQLKDILFQKEADEVIEERKEGKEEKEEINSKFRSERANIDSRASEY